MRVVISADGHEPPYHRMMVDNHAIPIDLTDVPGMVDATVARVTWEPVVIDGSLRETGCIYFKDGTTRKFNDQTALNGYLAAYKARKTELLGN